MRTLELLLLAQSVFFVLFQTVRCLFIYDGVAYPGHIPRNIKRQLSMTHFPVIDAPLIDVSNTYTTAGLGYVYPPTLIPYQSQPTVTTIRQVKSLPKANIQNAKRSPTPKPVVVKPVETYENFPEFENFKSTIAKEFQDFQQFNFDFGSSPSPSTNSEQLKKEVLLPVKHETFNTDLKNNYNTGYPNEEYSEGQSEHIKPREFTSTYSKDSYKAESNRNSNNNGRYSATNIEEIHSNDYYNNQPQYYNYNQQENSNYKVHEHKQDEKHEEKHEHQHKHLEKHGHKHSEKHGHEHKHSEKHGHEHKHEAKNKHVHEDIEHHHHEHKHIQHHHHLHKHEGEHKHNHLNKHKHKHEEHSSHHHGHHEEHKHGHEEGHKHVHGHKHENKHEHREGHTHKNGHHSSGYRKFGSRIEYAPANGYYKTVNKAGAKIHDNSDEAPKTREEYYYRYLGGSKVTLNGDEDSDRSEHYSAYAPQSSNYSQKDDTEQLMVDSSKDSNVWRPLLNSNPTLS